MIAAIEIGGTKLQIAMASSDHPRRLVQHVRFTVDRMRGADGILQQIVDGMRPWASTDIEQIGVGFGGPVDIARGTVITSHQVPGWDGFQLSDWFGQRWNVPVTIGNDCNLAALAEATLGAGVGLRRVFYVTIGTGVGGGLVIDGRVDGQFRPAIAEIGHLRPGLEALSPSDTVESIASGLGIERTVRRIIQSPEESHVSASSAADLAGCFPDGKVTASEVVKAAFNRQPLAARVLGQATDVLGWALAQATTLTAPERIVLGGGVSLSGAKYFAAVRQAWQRYVFPPLSESCDIVPAELGEDGVLFGAIQAVRLPLLDERTA